MQAAPDPHPDDALLSQGLSGNEAALQELLVRNLPALETYVRLRAPELVGPRESVADLAQSTCREILQDLGRFQHGGADHFRAWLFETAERKLLHRRRHHLAQRRDVRRVQALESEHDAARYLAGFRGVPTPSSHAEARERLAELVEALGTLPAADRRLVLLARVARVPRRVLAEREGKSEEALRQALHRALAALADAIAASRPRDSS
ncbi:MAG: sigma-70 family RNA polymerase sigma factor [Planctomycetota bacterium]